MRRVNEIYNDRNSFTRIEITQLVPANPIPAYQSPQCVTFPLFRVSRVNNLKLLPLSAFEFLIEN